jgi:hypothetical protein
MSKRSMADQPGLRERKRHEKAEAKRLKRETRRRLKKLAERGELPLQSAQLPAWARPEENR